MQLKKELNLVKSQLRSDGEGAPRSWGVDRNARYGASRTAPRTLQLLLAAAYQVDTKHAPSAAVVAELNARTSTQEQGAFAGLNKDPPKSMKKKPPPKPKRKKVSGIAAGVRVSQLPAPAAATCQNRPSEDDDPDDDDLDEDEADGLEDDDDPGSELPATTTLIHCGRLCERSQMLGDSDPPEARAAR